MQACMHTWRMLRWADHVCLPGPSACCMHACMAAGELTGTVSGGVEALIARASISADITLAQPEAKAYM